LDKHTAGRASRLWIGVISYVIACVCGVVLVLKWGELAFVSLLFLSFTLFLSASHAKYAFLEKLTVRSVKLIEYFYLGTATLGLILFAAAYEGQRNVHLMEFWTEMRPFFEKDVKQNIEKRLWAFIGAVCRPGPSKNAEFCDEGRQLVEMFERKFDTGSLREMERAFKNFLDEEGKRMRGETSSNNSTIWISASELLGALRDGIRDLGGGQTVSSGDEIQTKKDLGILLGLAQTVIWPFVLAFALAMRITKVTIEVLNWTEPAATKS
jgi:hypothetical protein